MKILLIAATEMEISFFENKNNVVDILITGFGVPSTIYHLQNKLYQKDYDLVLQAGITGAFTNEFNWGETVLVKQDCFADIGMEEKEIFTPIFETGFVNKNELPFNNGWLINNNEYLKKSTLELVKAITINKVSDSELQKNQLISIFNPEIESMEGAALHYVCLQNKTPFLQIRSISNYVGERDKTRWKIKHAIENLGKELTQIITNYPN